ncbi:Uncharacterised protein [Serratia marcescens]|uniref:hypothetical protein n=1 Tax=Serratia marcescens TaxID=615 RepID=UPI000744F777|nr:hypothetical protein [Serratia marcescens]CVH63863.1 Uncharacterised protein [Serratia marcescens]
MINRSKLEHILAYARQQKQFGFPTCRIPPGDMVEIMERLLAQPVSCGYKLVPVESTDAWAERYCELTNKHPDGGLTTYIGDGAVTITFREKSKREIDAMLAAAPEGGNDHDTRR